MKKELSIEGMMCGHCVAHVTKALEGVDGVTEVKVSLEDKKAVASMNNEISDDILKIAKGQLEAVLKMVYVDPYVFY